MQNPSTFGIIIDIILLLILVCVSFIFAWAKNKKQTATTRIKIQRKNTSQTPKEEQENEDNRKIRSLKYTIDSHAKIITSQSKRISQYQPPYEDPEYYTDLNEIKKLIDSAKQSNQSVEHIEMLEKLTFQCSDLISRQSNIIKQLDKKRTPLKSTTNNRKERTKRKYTYRSDRPQKDSVVTFIYTNLNGETKNRLVQITSVRGGYLHGIDLNAYERRTFNIDRIHNGEVTDCDTGQLFNLHQ